jgi:stress-induced morphogen
MEHGQIVNLLSTALEELNADIEVFAEDYDVLRIVVTSDSFIGVRLLKRIDMVIEKLTPLYDNELYDFTIVINPLTSNEKLYGISEIS